MSAEEFIDPAVLGRLAWERNEIARDVEVLRWVERFRFVTPEQLARRFGVSWQRANARVRRLERVGLLGTERAHVSQPRAVFVTGRGCELLGLSRRRPPRAEVQRTHEAAIVDLVCDLELAGTGPVLTERDCRRAQAGGDRLFSVSVALGPGRGSGRRWPDLVLDGPSLVAVEIELSMKAPFRLREIVRAYTYGRVFETVVFLAGTDALTRRLQRLSRSEVPDLPASLAAQMSIADLLVAPWPASAEELGALLAEERDGVEARGR